MAERAIRRALLSVSDKTQLVDLARGLAELGVELISTGGTRKALETAGLKVRDISDLTGFPEIMDGRVKTLHPLVHGGILAVRDNPEHQKAMQAHGIGGIDLVVCNLYPFEATVARPEASQAEIIENIDIGGPTLIRAAAKNFHDVVIATDPSQYMPILDEMRQQHGGVSPALRETLAAAAFARIAAYDQAIHAYFARRGNGESFPQHLSLCFEKKATLRYGENPHQHAAFYAEPGTSFPCVATARVLHGKELSYNNILDLDSAFNLVKEFQSPAAVIIKHNNPCGAAVGATQAEAFQRAYEGDPLSAFGGVFAFNHEVDDETAGLITEPNRFVECIIAPGYTEAAYSLLTTRPTWKKSVRLLATGPLTTGPESSPSWDYRRVDGGLLVQSRDRIQEESSAWKVVTKRSPNDQERQDLFFAWLVCKHVKSNAIVLAKDGMLVGVGAGQMSRVDSVHLASRKAGERSKGSVLASDAFFPFRDNVDAAAQVGVTAIAQPGGSVRDQDSIAACDEHGLAMLFTGIRHFRH